MKKDCFDFDEIWYRDWEQAVDIPVRENILKKIVGFLKKWFEVFRCFIK